MQFQITFTSLQLLRLQYHRLYILKFFLEHSHFDEGCNKNEAHIFTFDIMLMYRYNYL